MPFIEPPKALNTRRRSSQLSQSSTGSAFSATSAMSLDEVDNFRSMRGKAGHTSKDLSYHMNDDVDDLTDRLQDVKHSREIQKKLFDTTGEAYEILITSNDVRLMHVDEKGHYHFTHFNSERHRDDARKPIKQSWRVIDDEKADHTFVIVSPTCVTVYHSAGVWQCRRYRGKVWELEDSDRSRPISKKIPRPGGKKDKVETREWRLYVDTDDSDRSSNATPDEALLCANTPGEKGQHHRAHQSFYHDVK